MVNTSLGKVAGVFFVTKLAYCFVIQVIDGS